MAKGYEYPIHFLWIGGSCEMTIYSTRQVLGKSYTRVVSLIPTFLAISLLVLREVATLHFSMQF